MGFKVTHLLSGGLITNYQCSSRCAHCLYNCSPAREKGYISPDQARTNLLKVKELGCSSIHIGGGEPMLNIPGLLEVFDTANEAGVGIEYVETNSSWYQDPAQADKVLGQLHERGLRTLLVSISPFHNSYIPFAKVRGVIDACGRSRISIFPWIADFAGEVESLGNERAHKLDEYLVTFGSNYLEEALERYSITHGGRALSAYRKTLPLRPVEEILKEPSPCRTRLVSVSHFHVDLHGYYIPGLCTGLAVRIGDLGKGLTNSDYPVLNLLAEKGVEELYKIACKDFGFKADPEGYTTCCDLCTGIRRFLKKENKMTGFDLNPEGFYAAFEREKDK